MIDIKLVRENPEAVKAAAKNKNASVGAEDIDHLIELDQQRRGLTEQVDTLRQQRNELAATTKSAKPEAAQIEQGKKLKDEIGKLEADLAKVDTEFQAILKQIPNLPTDDVPVGESEDDNVVAKTVGEKSHFDFKPKNHWQLAEAHDWIDKERAAKVSGSRFAYIKGSLVRLQFALMQFGLSVLTDEDKLKQIAVDAGLNVSTKPFTPVLPPPMIRTEVYEATGRLNGAEVTYKLEDDDLWLNGSAEHSLCAMYQDEILAEADLPIRYVGYATSFRREAGTYGKDMEGIFRMHHFDKMEMESFTTADAGLDEHLFMVAIQEYLMQQLGLPYQAIMKCTADIGKPNARGVDINTWLPGQDKYRETHSADFISDYQTRALQTRIRTDSGSIELGHTNDATAFAMGRTLIAIIENYQTEAGEVRVPEVLQSYYGGTQL